MNVKVKIVSLVVLVGLQTMLLGQDIHFSQMDYFSPLSINPTLAGANHDLQATGNFRNQWSSVASPYQTLAFSIDSRLNPATPFKPNKKAIVAVGVDFFNDKAGSERISTTSANLHVATHVMLGEGHTIGLGLQGGWSQRSINPNEGQWANQYDGMHYNPSLPTGENFNSTQFNLFDVGAGLLYTWNATDTRIGANNKKYINFGYSVFHLNRPGYSFLNQKQEKMYMRHSLFVNGYFGITQSHFAIEPGIYYFRQGNAQEIHLGLYGKYILKGGSQITNFVEETSISLGLFYRNRDALIAKFIFEWHGIGIGVAYDVNLFNTLTTASKGRGGLEIGLRWILSDFTRLKQQGKMP